MNFAYGGAIDAFCREQPQSGNCKVRPTVPVLTLAYLPALDTNTPTHGYYNTNSSSWASSR